jgi:uncharacterized membrane protein YagU involved in acid resistance
MKILLGGFSAKVGREDIFRPTTGNESLHEISNDNGVRVVNFARSKNLHQNTVFSHSRIPSSGMLHHVALVIVIYFKFQFIQYYWLQTNGYRTCQ